MVGQRPAQRGRIEAGQPFDEIGEDADLEGSKVIVVVWERLGKPLLQEAMEGLEARWSVLLMVGSGAFAHFLVMVLKTRRVAHVPRRRWGFLKTARRRAAGVSPEVGGLGFEGFWIGGSERTLLNKSAAT